MSEEPKYIALTIDQDAAWYGYAKGVGHIVRTDVLTFGGDHIGGAGESMPLVCVEGKSLETSRVVEKVTGDAKCKRCMVWFGSSCGGGGGVGGDIQLTRDAIHLGQGGESVADMIMSDPGAVLITLDSALAEDTAPSGEEEEEEGSRSVPLAGMSFEAFKAAGRVGPTTRNGAKELPEPKNPSKPDKRAREVVVDPPVRCLKDAPCMDVGGGRGECRSCGWRGPVKEVVTMRAPEDVTPCACPCLHKKTHGARAKCLHRDKCAHKTVTTTVMTAHWRGGRAPQQVTMGEDYSDQSLAQSPATVDTGNRSADDMIGGSAAGTLPGRTSLTRGRPLDADKVTGPTERRTHKVTGESLPSSTTMDGPLGRPRIDARSVVREIAGGEYGYHTPEEVGKLNKTARRRYWRHVATNRDRAKRGRAMVAAREAQLKARAEKDAARRLADAVTA